METAFSDDELLMQRGRQLAAVYGIQLDQVINELLERRFSQSDIKQNAEEFAHLAKYNGGSSHEDFAFDRDSTHVR